jgi:triosephosphate isomerase
MRPLLCVGERTPAPAAAALDPVTRQLRGALGALDPGELGRVVVAYEPVWAIGVGAMAAPLDHIRAMHAGIHRWLAARDASSTPVLYGGSVDAGTSTYGGARFSIRLPLEGGAEREPEAPEAAPSERAQKL